ncbi:hypothetical protein SAMN05428984_3343 [Sphingomonas sp. OK281]|nr:hypothetical protein SAMN05428984_3343 [Sphingomonas sp. OK281]
MIPAVDEPKIEGTTAWPVPSFQLVAGGDPVGSAAEVVGQGVEKSGEDWWPAPDTSTEPRIALL